jgi:uncharacterized Fe-S cluster-containing radical SAM superfamily protein
MVITLRKGYSPQICVYPAENPEFFELRWELVGCILGCEFCKTPASKPEKLGNQIIELNPTQIFDIAAQNIVDPSKSFIRFTGGEPTIYWKEVIEVLKQLANNETTVDIPIVIQTNGISIGNGTVNVYELNRTPFNRLKILFELSIKGTNSEEFELLTRTSKKLYAYQIKAYKLLKNARSHNRNLSFICVLGIYHSSNKEKESTFVFVYPNSNIPMFDRHKPWDKEFENMWKETKRKWAEPLKTSPKRIWENILKRCGSEGAGLLKHFQDGVPTNPESIFPPKPESYEYAYEIVTHDYW